MDTSDRADFSRTILQAFQAFNESSEDYKIVVVLSDKDADLDELSKTIEDLNQFNEVLTIICQGTCWPCLVLYVVAHMK